jgi:radical SAM protein with 4Fe4S-binding SPASM domain
MIYYHDKKYNFAEVFNPKNGFYVRSGVFDENGKDTGVDPFMRSFPQLIDVGIMERCVCSNKCKVDCYQKACDRTGENMSLDDYRSIMEQGKGKIFQVALGGAGDPDTHEHFEEILKLTREYGIVPNFTTSGITFTKEKAEICKRYCGAVAVSWHNEDYTYKAIDMLIKAGVKTNIHYVLSAKSIDEAIERLRNNTFPEGINAIVFLLYKPIGLGKMENILTADNPNVNEFFKLVDKNDFDFKIGFDSCSCAGIVNNTENVNLDSIDFCEGGRYSMYISADMNAMPCSFGNQNPKWYVDLRKNTIEEAWNGEVFERFRSSLRNSCPNCPKRNGCAGGCPICREVVLCDNPEKELV